MKIVSPRILFFALIVIIVSLSAMAIACRKDRMRTEQTVTDIETTTVERMHVTAIERRLGTPLPPSAQLEYYRHTICPDGELHLLRTSLPDAVWQQYVDDTHTILSSYWSGETHYYRDGIDTNGVHSVFDVEPLVEYDDKGQVIAQETRTIVIKYRTQDRPALDEQIWNSFTDYRIKRLEDVMLAMGRSADYCDTNTAIWKAGGRDSVNVMFDVASNRVSDISVSREHIRIVKDNLPKRVFPYKSNGEFRIMLIDDVDSTA